MSGNVFFFVCVAIALLAVLLFFSMIMAAMQPIHFEALAEALTKIAEGDIFK